MVPGSRHRGWIHAGQRPGRGLRRGARRAARPSPSARAARSRGGGRPGRADRGAARRPPGRDDGRPLEAGRPPGPRSAPGRRPAVRRPGRDAGGGRGLDRAVQGAGLRAVDAGGHDRADPQPEPGAVAALIASLAEGVARHVAEVRGRLPGATLLLQLDEPALPAVLAGSVPTASGLNRVGAVDRSLTTEGLRSVLAATTAFGLVHCCASGIPFGLLREAGAQAVAFDMGLLRREDEDNLAELVEADLGIFAGVIQSPLRDAPLTQPSPRDPGADVLGLWHRRGIPLRGLDRQVGLPPACGLAGASPAAARATLARCREAARLLPELIEEGVA